MEGAFKVIILAGLYVLAFFLVECLGFLHPFGWTYSGIPCRCRRVALFQVVPAFPHAMCRHHLLGVAAHVQFPHR